MRLMIRERRRRLRERTRSKAADMMRAGDVAIVAPKIDGVENARAMRSIGDIPKDVLASHVLSHLPFEKLCACVSAGGSLRPAAIEVLQAIPRVRALQELKFRERAEKGASVMSKEHFVCMLTTMRGLRHVVCDSTVGVAAGHALANLVHAMREVEALLGRQVRSPTSGCLVLVVVTLQAPYAVFPCAVFVSVAQVHAID